MRKCMKEIGWKESEREDLFQTEDGEVRDGYFWG